MKKLAIAVVTAAVLLGSGGVMGQDPESNGVMGQPQIQAAAEMETDCAACFFCRSRILKSAIEDRRPRDETDMIYQRAVVELQALTESNPGFSKVLQKYPSTGKERKEPGLSSDSAKRQTLP